jgi:glycosyltransferase involved in cell wall biosynthesis
MRLVIISICKDESKTIAKVLDEIPKKIKGISNVDKWVIDDGSKDKTATIAQKHGAKVISDGANKKLAFRFREAIDLALEQGADIMVNIDGDYQFDSSDISKLVEPIVNGRADFVSADRFTHSSGKKRKPVNMSVGKYFGNLVGAWIIGTFSSNIFADVTCGFRAYSKKALIALNTTSGHTYTQETFQILAMKKHRIETVPINVRYFKGRKSRVVVSIPSYISISAVNILRSYRDLAPLRFFGILGLIPFLIGFISGAIFFAHWFSSGSISPYKFLGFVAAYFITLGVFFWGIGLVADMLSRMLSNQEQILEHTKHVHYKIEKKRK